MEPTVLNHESVLSCLPDRKPDSHKGDYGKILLLCGSMGYTGAAALAADTNDDKALSITDFLQIKAHILGKNTVKPHG